MAESETVNTGCSGCVKGVAIFFFGSMLLILVWNAVAGGPEMIDMRGEVVITHPADILVLSNDRFCRGFGRLADIAGNTDISIWARGGTSSSTMTELSSGMTMPDGSCVFGFSATVREADRYTFEILGLSEVTREASEIVTIGENGEQEIEVRLSW